MMKETAYAPQYEIKCEITHYCNSVLRPGTEVRQHAIDLLKDTNRGNLCE